MGAQFFVAKEMRDAAIKSKRSTDYHSARKHRRILFGFSSRDANHQQNATSFTSRSATVNASIYTMSANFFPTPTK